MTKSLYIAEKPSVAQEFAKALKQNMQRRDGYLESDQSVVTWCVGHLVTMSYPEKYDPALKRWSLETLPFLPENFKYEIIPEVKKQFTIVSNLLHREDIETIYVCTDSGREGEYIYRLVAQMAGIKDKKQKRVWIDSQTEEEILRGIREAKDESEYDNLSASAYLRAKEDYLMGINFSRLLSLKYGSAVASYLGTKYQSISVGRVMTCVLGMVVRREREIRSFVKTPFYRVIAGLSLNGRNFEGEWRAVKGSRYFNSPLLYKENGFQKKEDAQKLIEELSMQNPLIPHVLKMERKKENKNAPLLYNLAELQNDCARFFKISPDETLKVVQELYEKKLLPIREPMPVCFLLPLPGKSAKTCAACSSTVSAAALQMKFRRVKAGKRLVPPAIQTINRLPITMRSFRPDRALTICGTSRNSPQKFMRQLSAVFSVSSIRRRSIRKLLLSPKSAASSFSPTSAFSCRRAI